MSAIPNTQQMSAQAVICGAGIAGISAAYYLAVRHGLREVVLVDERAPLSLTSDKSSECYRNWWPGQDDAMIRLMNRSIDLLEEMAQESGNVFHMNRRGYLYCSAQPEKLEAEAQQIAKLGGLPLRIHQGKPTDPAYIPHMVEGFTGQPDGADLLLGPETVQQYFPYLSSAARAALHVRRAGWFSAQQLGMYMLQKAREQGARLVSGRVVQVDRQAGAVAGVQLADGTQIYTQCFVIAAGPMIEEVAHLLDLKLPIAHELHLKVNFNDNLGIIERSAPLLIWNDEQQLEWSEEERDALEQDESTRWLVEMLPGGAHCRPEGGPESQAALLLWDYHSQTMQPEWPIPIDPFTTEIVLRGLVRLLPGLKAYLSRLPRAMVDGGYYTKMPENRPLIGRLPVEGAFVSGAHSGYGLMVAPAAGELLAARVLNQQIPDYWAAFALERTLNPGYNRLLENLNSTGQL